MKTLILPFIFFFTLTCFANERGNGGGSIVCRDETGKITSAEIIDYYEMKEILGEEYVYEATLSHTQYIRTLSQKLMSYDPQLFSKFEEVANILLEAIQGYRESDSRRSQFVIMTPQSLPLIDDFNVDLVKLPAHCSFEQMVANFTRAHGWYTSYFINTEITGAIDEANVRGIIIHEALYFSLGKEPSLDIKNSDEVRAFHRELISGPLSDFDSDRYQKLMKKLFQKYRF